MQVVNDYDRDVFNGDLGVISSIDPAEEELSVSFDGRDVSHGFGELDELVLAYATQHYPMLVRKLLYTGMTRGKRLVVLVGQRRALAIAVRNQDGRRRWTRLREWLADAKD